MKISFSGTLTGIAAGLQRFMQNDCNRRDVWLLKKDDMNFKMFRDALDTRRKQLIAAGVGVVHRQADPVTDDDEKQLWDSAVFNINTSQGLSYIVYFYNCKLFGFRARDEHVELMAEQYKIFMDNDIKCLQYSGRLAKNVTGNFASKSTPRVIVQRGNPNNPRCIVSIFELYLSYIPPNGRFYRRPLNNNTCVQFSQQHLGINKLNNYMQDMFRAAKIDVTGRFISGHSGKVTCCTQLYAGNFDEQSIKSRSGHRSEAVRLYKRQSTDLQQKLSDQLQPPCHDIMSNCQSSSQVVEESCTGLSDTSHGHEQGCQNVGIESSVSATSETRKDVKPLVKLEPEIDCDDGRNDTLVIQVPAVVRRVVLLKNGKKITMEL
jgi:hypothetical protein